jgi:uncharacterized membrane protein
VDEPKPAPTHYDLLGVAPTADAEELKTAYRAAAVRHHPDRVGSGDAMVELNAAYGVLSDPTRRAAYDQTLRTGVPSDPAPRLRSATLAGLAYLLPFPAFPVAFFVGHKGLWPLRFHAAQAFLSASVSALIFASALLVPPLAVVWLGFAAAVHLELALAASGDLSGTSPVRLPVLGRYAAMLADIGGTAGEPYPDGEGFRHPVSRWAAVAYLLPVPTFPFVFLLPRPGRRSIRFHAAQSFLSAARTIAGAAVAVSTVGGVQVVAWVWVVYAIWTHFVLWAVAAQDRDGTDPKGPRYLGAMASWIAGSG